MAGNKLAVWEIVIPAANITKESVIEKFNEHCKKWTFQLEKGAKTGYLHYQCRVSLKVRSTVNLTQKKFAEFSAHILPTVTQNMGNDFYVLKPETREDGPWRNTDEEQGYIQQRFRQEITWRPWQIDIIEMIKTKADDRSINVIFDTQGNRGKSFLAAYCAQHGLARVLPSLNDYKDICQFAMSLPAKNAYFLDMPRGIPKKHLNGIYSGLENLKNGWLFDIRYHAKEMWIEPPHIWVFSNVLPDRNVLSADRWKIWTILEDELVDFYDSR